MKMKIFCILALLAATRLYASGGGEQYSTPEYNFTYQCKDDERGIEFYARATGGWSYENHFDKIIIKGFSTEIALESNSNIRLYSSSHFDSEKDFHASSVSNIELRRVSGEVIGFGFYRNSEYQLEFIPTMKSGYNFLRFKVMGLKNSEVIRFNMFCKLTVEPV